VYSPAAPLLTPRELHRSFAAQNAAQDDNALGWSKTTTHCGFCTTRCSFVTDLTAAFCHASRRDYATNQDIFRLHHDQPLQDALYGHNEHSLIRRVREHKLGIGSGFTTKYKLDRLVYFERFEDVHRAIGREKTIKGWLRIKKIALIVSVNPAWRDLSAGWYERHQFQPEDGDASRRVTNLGVSS
jgi:putative endonuclease